MALTRQLSAHHPDGASGLFTFGSCIVGFEAGHSAIPEYLLSGFIDLQVNSGFGIDVMSASADDLRKISRHLLEEGTTAWLATVTTAPLDLVERIDLVIADAIAAQEDDRRRAQDAGTRFAEAAILGMHLEGPFLSPQRLGAHPPLNLLPKGEALDRVMRLKTLRLITLAPELDGALDAIRALVEQQIAVSIGHTDASYDEAMAGVSAGARMFTHVFNAMRPLHHRQPGAAGAALSQSSAMMGLIADGVHVHPAMLQIAWRARGSSSTLLTSDRVALAGSAPGRSVLFSNAGVTIRDGAARKLDGSLAGSIVTMLDAVRLMRRYVDLDMRGIMSIASGNPGGVLGLHDRGNLLPGSRADLLLLDRDLNLKTVFIDGQEVT